MCGIFGYVGEPTDLGRSVTAALKTLEYRGYDSWGIAIGNGDQILVEKQVGRINGTVPEFPRSGLGFGHTRWATHGGVTKENAHPHLDGAGRVAIIHNGIIDNYQRLRADLAGRGHLFQSETDSEVVAFLIAEEMAAGRGLVEALARTFTHLDGLNAIIAMDVASGEMAAAKNASPLVAGIGSHGFTIASDVLALGPHADRVLYLEDNHLVRLGRDGLSLYERASLDRLHPTYTTICHSAAAAELGPYPHFMVKEIADQPAVLQRLATSDTLESQTLATAIAEHPSVAMTGCGSASYAAMTGSFLLGRIAGRNAPTIVGSEFKYHRHLLTPESLVVALSQSGETADLIEAMLLARQSGARLAALVNVEHSTLDRLVDFSYHLHAGPEQCVLATKSYLAKVAALLLTAHALGGAVAEGRSAVLDAADIISAMLDSTLPAQIEMLACRIRDRDHMFVIGRGLSYPTALEAALKIKESSYMHAEAFAGGELKHGVIALIEQGTPCLVFAPDDETRTDILSGATELKSRGAFIIGVSPTPDPVFDVHLEVPESGHAAPLTNAVPAQLLGYHLAVLRGHNPDRPRNLAKSVTVK